MIYVAPPIDARWGIPLFLAVLVGTAFLAFYGAKQTTLEREANSAIRANALALWMQECPHAVDQCAISWDDSYTLRTMYTERVK